MINEDIMHTLAMAVSLRAYGAQDADAQAC